MASLSLLQNGKPSISAQRVALRRAAHQVLDTPRVFDDPLALMIVGSEDASQLTASPHKLDDLESRFIRAFMAVRSRYAEDQLAEALSRGVVQYVVLGAGLDTFAYRNPYNPWDLQIFEVDHPATQQWKRERLASASIPIPEGLTFVPVDFERRELAECLSETSFRPNVPTFFSWLGVTPYLTTAAFSATLQFIASMPAGSGVVFDYAVSRSSLSVMEQSALDILSDKLAVVGEPFRLFFEPKDLVAAMRDFGFVRIEDLATVDINARYFKDRADGLRVFGGFAHLLSAVV